MHDEDAMRYIMKLMGEDKICMGSDYPFPLGEHEPGKLIENMQLDKATEEKLLSKNAMKWLGHEL